MTAERESRDYHRTVGWCVRRPSWTALYKNVSHASQAASSVDRCGELVSDLEQVLRPVAVGVQKRKPRRASSGAMIGVDVK